MAIVENNELFFTAFEPKQANRFIMYMDGFPTYMIRKAGDITIDNGEVTLNHINVLRKLKGKTKWGDFSLTLFDPITPSGAQAVMEWVRLHHESVTGRNGYAQFYKKDLSLNILGPVGDIVSEWIVKGAYIKSATFVGYDWDTENQAQTIDLNLGIDYMILNF